MTLRSRFTLLFIFVAIVPFSLPIMGYLYFRLTIPESVVREITAAPPFVTRDLHKIIDGTISPEEIDRRILIVIHGDHTPSYINPGVQRFISKHNLSNPRRPGDELELLTALSEKESGDKHKTMIGNALFTYRNIPGLVFFRFAPENPLLYALGHPLTTLTVIFIVIILIPLLLSSRFLFPLRKSLAALETSAGRIQSGDLSGSVIVPLDPELKPVFEAFEKMRQQLKEDQEQQARFLMSVSHDLKTPLTSIRGFIEALQDGVIQGEEETSRGFDVIRRKTDLLEERISELIETTRINTDGWRRSFAPIPVKDFAREVFEPYAIEAEARGLDFSTRIEVSEDLRIQGNRRMLARAVENLVENAVRYAGKAAEILAGAEECSGMLRITVEDSGPGISEKDEPLLFEPFYRGDRGRNSRGIGLGLSSVRSIAEAHGGTVGLMKSSLGGAGIFFEIPLYKNPH
ncbi:HAMP domain-containing sensor histidine kinase [Marispirochaeta sp.]|uniref:HAMP domain-containing sensor histidine kinase n=1 Tax=Marispirochaeta sp. TaxID=2038653 RepID=UPI0029C8642D|nr:HAMP domain-containing sensor histidine kinase [Marispirochaeta sp.]